MKLGCYGLSHLEIGGQSFADIDHAAFSPGPWMTQGALLGSVFSRRARFVGAMLRHITLNTPIRFRLGVRP